MKYHSFIADLVLLFKPSKISKNQHAAYTHALIQCKGSHARGYADANADAYAKNERPNKRPNETPMVMTVTLQRLARADPEPSNQKTKLNLKYLKL